jgi:hypothetical protein
MKHRVHELEDLYVSCSTHLFQNLAKEGVAYWWDNRPDLPKGGAVFFYYDGTATCLRLMPKAPRFFGASVKSGLLSQADASLLGRRLLATIGVLLERYSGAFAEELRSGLIGRHSRHCCDPEDFGLHDAHEDLTPDDVYAAIPWPLIPSLHFNDDRIAPAGIRGDYIAEASQEMLRAISLAADIVTFGPSFRDDAPRAIMQVLNHLQDGPYADAVKTFMSPRERQLQKIIVPCFSGGFQGIAFGIFERLPSPLEPFIISQLQQFAATVGENIALLRAQEGKLALQRASTLSDYVEALANLLPPVEQVICVRGKDKAGLGLVKESCYYAGYRQLSTGEIDTALANRRTQIVSLEDADIQIGIRMPPDCGAVSPLFTFLRIQPQISSLPRPTADTVEPLTQSELAALQTGLRRQVRQERGAIAATKKLFLIDAVLQHYDRREITLSNAMAKEFAERTLGRAVSGYHVTGKAAQKFEDEMQKLAPQRFLFQKLSANAIKVRWRVGDRQGTI